jgi:hypothetical protein
MKPRLLSYISSYDEASNICKALTVGTCMLYKATPLERVLYSNFAALFILLLVGVFYYTSGAHGWGEAWHIMFATSSTSNAL